MKIPVLEVRLDIVYRNAAAIKSQSGTMLFPTVKADAYGLGATAITETLRDTSDSFCVFSLEEAFQLRSLVPMSTPIRLMGPTAQSSASECASNNLIVSVFNEADAVAFACTRTMVAVDVGFARFAAPIDMLETLLSLSGSNEVMTALTTSESIARFDEATRCRGLFRHAAASAQLDTPAAMFDAVRPGIALYKGAVRLCCEISEVHENTVGAGYSRFSSPRFGVILLGYADGLRLGPCIVNGENGAIVEVGMQSSCVTSNAAFSLGSVVTVLGPDLDCDLLSAHWKCRPHEVLISLAKTRIKKYTDDRLSPCI